MMSIHPTAIVSQNADIGSNVSIGAFSIVHDNVVIGDHTVIESHCEIGYATPRANGNPLLLGNGTRIRSHSIFYEGSSFGPDLITGHHVSVREGTVAGKNLQVGTYSDIQGDCEIGNYVRLHSNVHVGELSRIDDFVWLLPYVVLTNDPHPPSNYLLGVSIGKYAAIATHSVIMPGVRIGEGTLIGAKSMVKKDVPDNMVAVGSPARILGKASMIKLKDGSQRSAYPWITHFHRGYPEEVVSKWLQEIKSTESK